MPQHELDLRLDLALGERYKSATQRARVMSEAWTESNAFCFSCGGTLAHARPNASVLDFTCTNCSHEFELKSARGSISTRLPDGAFRTMMARLSDPASPDFLFLTYDPSSSEVTNFFAVPTCFFDASVIEERKPLSLSALRAGWVGCNIVMAQIPDPGKVFFVRNRQVLGKRMVMEAWNRTAFLKGEMGLEARSWTLEILRVVQSLRTHEFTLQEVYAFEDRLKRRFPNNNFIRPKIRQQLQVLRDAGLLVFKGRGRYGVASHAAAPGWSA